MKKIDEEKLEGLWRHADLSGMFYLYFRIKPGEESVYSKVRKSDGYVLSEHREIIRLQEEGEQVTVLFGEYRYPVYEFSDDQFTLLFGREQKEFSRVN